MTHVRLSRDVGLDGLAHNPNDAAGTRVSFVFSLFPYEIFIFYEYKICKRLV
jgi:hypothetical protein